MQLEQAAKIWAGNILTIRNRWNVFTGVPLADAIKAAKKHMPTLKTFHAVFCRSDMMVENSPSATAQLKK